MRFFPFVFTLHPRGVSLLGRGSVADIVMVTLIAVALIAGFAAASARIGRHE